MYEYNIDSARLWNLNETGNIPGSDIRSNSRKKRYSRRSEGGDLRTPKFVRCERSTMMSVISASVEAEPRILYTGASLPYRNVVVEGRVATQTFTNFLLRGACVAMRAENIGVGTTNFEN